MRLRFSKLDPVERAAFHERLAIVLDPASLAPRLRSIPPFSAAALDGASCTLWSRHPDRFVVRLDLRCSNGVPSAYALKGFIDDRGVTILALYQQLVETRHDQLEELPLYAPLAYLSELRLLISPWITGPPLPELLGRGQFGPLEQAAITLAWLHRTPIVPEAPTTASAIVADTLARCERLCERWPIMAPLVCPLQALLVEALPMLNPARPALVHGDPAPDQFLWTGSRLILLDFDMCGYTDPAYDAGHFLAQLQRSHVMSPGLHRDGAAELARFRRAYLNAAPNVSPRHISFYQGVTLTRKLYTVCRQQPEGWQEFVVHLADAARAALSATIGPERPHE